MELHDRLARRDALVGDYVLAGVVAFCGAVPEQQAMEDGWQMLERFEGLKKKRVRMWVEAWPLPQFSISQTWNVD